MTRVRLRALACALLLLAVPLRLAATSVRPTGVEELALVAGSSVRATVEAVDTRAAEGMPVRQPRTLVTLRTLEALSGRAGARLTLNLPGGSIGGRQLTVHGMPRFRAGEEVIVFLSGNTRAFSPVVALGYGVFRVDRTDPASPLVRREDGSVVTSLAATNTPLATCAACDQGDATHAHAARPTSEKPLALEAFTAGIRSFAERAGRGPVLER